MTSASQGAGQDGIVFIHGSLDPDALHPLVECKALAAYNTVGYRRRAYRCDQTMLPVSVAQDVRDCAQVLDVNGLERAHLVGHSHGALVALDFAKTYPDRVSSVVLLEAGVSAHVPSAALAAPSVLPSIELYQSGHALEALESLTKVIFGKDSTFLPPHDLDERCRFARATFESDLPAQAAWQLHGPEDLKGTKVLSIIGASSSAYFKQSFGIPLIEEIADLLRRMIPHHTERQIEGATHALPMTHAEQAGAMIAAFIEPTRG